MLRRLRAPAGRGGTDVDGVVTGPVRLPEVLPQRPRVRRLRADQVGVAPGAAAVGADLDARDGLLAGPGDAEEAVAAQAEHLVGARAEDLRFHGHRADD